MKLLAISGGVDSMVLLNMYKYDKIGVIHINHNTRGLENIKEQNLIKQYCQTNNIPLYLFEYKHQTGNFHKHARDYRYEKYKYIIENYGYDSVYTGHHFDDQIENILMNPKKIGIKIMNYEENINGITIRRPLLSLTKNFIYKYSNENNIAYLEDSSNSSNKYLRNQKRKELKKYNYEEKKELYDKEVENIISIREKIKKFKNIKNIKGDDLNTIKDIYCFLKSKNIKSNISENKIKLALRFIKSNKNGKIYISSNVHLCNSYGSIRILKKQDEKIVNKKKLKLGLNNFNGIEFNNDKYEGYIKTYSQGDKIKIKNGSKKVSRFFIDQKIPKELRNKWPIITNNNKEIVKIYKVNEVNIREIDGL